MRRRNLLATVGAGAVALAGCSTGLADDEYDVGMTANQFQPSEVTVSAGDRLVWGNPSSRGHSVTGYQASIPDGAAYFASGGFDSEQAARDGYPNRGNLVPGDTYAHTFEVPGEYRYFCIPHERVGMVGTVVVE
ncbi:plastocyanin/azurin family copper-binding protein [Halosegnis sp.]|uniref:plastocyanin/azurin family copper-binding protein n=1 Tax=Halosegnis sp. TaxID=2864959 RepID=UPI0035D47AE2